MLRFRFWPAPRISNLQKQLTLLLHSVVLRFGPWGNHRLQSEIEASPWDHGEVSDARAVQKEKARGLLDPGLNRVKQRLLALLVLVS